jgi:IclR family acetate operon transcriptional repressor
VWLDRIAESGSRIPVCSRLVAPVRRDSVQSVERSCDLLETLSAAGELGLTDLAARTSLVPSTAHRLLQTLSKRGYVAQNPETGRYRLGYKIVEVAGTLEHRLARLRAVAHGHLDALQRATGETVNLVVLDAGRVVYIDQVQGSRSVRMFTAVGAAAPAHTTGSGKAIMAFEPPELAETMYAGLEPLERLTPHTLVTLEALEADFARIRRRRYAIDNEEHEEGVACVAGPIFDHTGRPVAAISVSGPSARILHGGTAELGALIIEHADEISAALGHAAVAEPAAG